MAAFVSRPPLTPGSFERPINPADIHREGVRGLRMRITQEEPLGEILSDVPGAINNLTSLHSPLNKTSYCQLLPDKLHNRHTEWRVGVIPLRGNVNESVNCPYIFIHCSIRSKKL